jgi:hypothetical protein
MTIVLDSPINAISNDFKTPRIGTNNAYMTSACKCPCRIPYNSFKVQDSRQKTKIDDKCGKGKDLEVVADN